VSSHSGGSAAGRGSDGAIVLGNGRRLWAERRGSGRPLVLLPGMATHSGVWPPTFLESLGDDLLLIDHRATGRSGRDRSAFSVADLADDVAAVLAAEKIEEADVLGFSLGGLVAQELALSRRDVIRRLVLIGTSAGGDASHGLDAQAIQPLLDAMAAFDGELAMRVSWEASVSPAFAGDAAAYAEWSKVATAAPFSLATLGHQYTAALGHDASDRLNALQAPTVVVHGTRDALIPFGDARRLARLIPGARLELIEGAGHLVFWEQPDRVAGIVREHLA